VIQSIHVQWVDHLSQCGVPAFDTPGPQHLERDREFEVVQRDGAVSGAGPVVKVHQWKARRHQRAGVSNSACQRADQSLQLQIFEFTAAAAPFIALDAFQPVQDEHVRRVAGERQLQALQHSAGGRVLFAREIDVGLA
jgi:hypothetical protein